MKKLILALLILCLIGCVSEPVKKEAPKPELVKISSNTWQLKSEYLKTARDYFFKHDHDIDYQAIINDIFKIQGVQNVTPAFYQLTIIIAKNYNWDEIEPEIVKILDNVSTYLLAPMPEAENNKSGL
uniref:Uncharacterized protein n=1 Tax=viral metagenome TaxID=1070528 RepID=A0A6M3LKY2_9ZZZZ